MTQKAIVCVDDEMIILSSLQEQILSAFGSGYHCEIAESAEEALELLDELHSEGFEVLLVVSDWLMPEMKGDEFLIQVHERWPQMTKLMLTGQAHPEAIERARRRARLTACIEKPWNPDELLQILHECLHNHPSG